MQISAITRIASSSTQWPSAQPQAKPAATSSSNAAKQMASASGSSSASKIADSSLGKVQNSASSTQVSTIAASYSTTVGGRSYAGSVEESGGRYTASVPMPPGVSASGASVQSAEDKLNIILDTLA